MVNAVGVTNFMRANLLMYHMIILLKKSNNSHQANHHKNHFSRTKLKFHQPPIAYHSLTSKEPINTLPNPQTKQARRKTNPLTPPPLSLRPPHNPTHTLTAHKAQAKTHHPKEPQTQRIKQYILLPIKKAHSQSLNT
jgi:hypothetical protein